MDGARIPEPHVGVAQPRSGMDPLHAPPLRPRAGGSAHYTGLDGRVAPAARVLDGLRSGETFPSQGWSRPPDPGRPGADPADARVSPGPLVGMAGCAAGSFGRSGRS